MGIYQLIVIGLYLVSLGIHLAKHGEPKEGNYSFWSALFSTVMILFCLTKGGFFS